MKAFIILSLVLSVACSPSRPIHRAAASTTSDSKSVSKNTDPVPPTLPTLEEKQVESIMASQETVAAEPVNIDAVPTAPDTSESQDMAAEVREVFATAQNSQGKQLSAAQVDVLTNGFMNFVTVAQEKKPAKTAAAWNQLMATVKEMNVEAKAQDAGGLIGDILDLALDLIDLAGELIVAVLKLDVAGVLDVALDLIDLIIDFLV